MMRCYSDESGFLIAGVGLRVFPHFHGDDSASGDPNIAIDLDPISEVLLVPVEEAGPAAQQLLPIRTRGCTVLLLKA